MDTELYIVTVMNRRSGTIEDQELLDVRPEFPQFPETDERYTVVRYGNVNGGDSLELIWDRYLGAWRFPYDHADTENGPSADDVGGL